MNNHKPLGEFDLYVPGDVVVIGIIGRVTHVQIEV